MIPLDNEDDRIQETKRPNLQGCARTDVQGGEGQRQTPVNLVLEDDAESGEAIFVAPNWPKITCPGCIAEAKGRTGTNHNSNKLVCKIELKRKERARYRAAVLERQKARRGVATPKASASSSSSALARKRPRRPDAEQDEPPLTGGSSSSSGPRRPLSRVQAQRYKSQLSPKDTAAGKPVDRPVGEAEDEIDGLGISDPTGKGTPMEELPGAEVKKGGRPRIPPGMPHGGLFRSLKAGGQRAARAILELHRR